VISTPVAVSLPTTTFQLRTLQLQYLQPHPPRPLRLLLSSHHRQQQPRRQH
jgi:hypothetical protein